MHQPQAKQTVLLGERPPESAPLGDLLQDYWNEWAGVLMWLDAKPHDRDRAFSEKAALTGGKLIKNFEERFSDAIQRRGIARDEMGWIVQLDRLANLINEGYASSTLTVDYVQALAGHARLIIYEHYPRESQKAAQPNGCSTVANRAFSSWDYPSPEGSSGEKAGTRRS